MKSVKEIKQSIKKLKVESSDKIHIRILDKLLSVLDKSKKEQPARIGPNIGRKIMRSPITKLAASAIFLIACIIGLAMFNKTSGVALGDVMAQIEKISTYSCQHDNTLSGIKAISTTDAEQKVHSDVIFSREYGMKSTQEVSNPESKNITVQEIYILKKENIMLSILHDRKSYTQEKIDNTYIERQINQNYDSRALVQQILDCKYKSLGRSTIDGIEVDGFQTTDPNFQGGVYNHAKIDFKLWVDVKTKLPVQTEMNIQMRDGKGYNISQIVHNFQWNIPLKASDFEPNIPQDYKEFSSGIKIPPITEEIAIKGLKLFVDLTGKYPEMVTPDTLEPQVDKLKEALDNLELDSENPEELAKFQTIKNMNISMTITSLSLFYIVLNQDKKEPAYYGDRVSPGEAGQVLMRWKVEEGVYRVIFGDLSAKNVSPKELAELEAKLPK